MTTILAYDCRLVVRGLTIGDGDKPKIGSNVKASWLGSSSRLAARDSVSWGFRELDIT